MSKAQLKEVLEPDFMAELGYVQSVQANKNKEVKSNTKMNYTQIKYGFSRINQLSKCCSLILI